MWQFAAGLAANQLLNQGNNKGSSDIYENMVNEAKNLPLPVLKQYYPDLYKEIIQLNPEVEAAVNLGPSEMGNISTDPRLRQAQMNALSKLEQLGAGGLSMSDKAQLGQIQNESNAALQGQMGAIKQNLASRGMGGGMSELVSRQMAAQNASNQAANQGMNVAAQAEQRALDAIMRSGQLGGQMQGEDFQRQAQVAQARDAINRFNAQNTQSVNQRNVDTRNQAMMTNAQNKQNISNQNVGLRNQGQQYNLGLAQQQFNNELSKRGLGNAAASSLAQSRQQEQQANQQFFGNLLSAGAQAYGASQKNKDKKDNSDGW